MNLVEIDQSIFLWINSDMSNVIFDLLMPLIRNKWIWIPFYLFILAFALFNQPKKYAYGFILSLVLAVGISDFGSSKIIKPMVERPRPCQNKQIENQIIERVACGTGYSFTSSHAANHFSIAFFLILTLGRKIPRMKFPLILWASLISFAQIYAGLHYPSDIFFGALFGIVICSFITELYKRTSLYSEF